MRRITQLRRDIRRVGSARRCFSGVESTGEEFMDDERRKTKGARKLKLPPSVVKRLSKVNDIQSAASVAQTVSVSALSVSAPFLFGFDHWIVLLSLILTASRQQALFVLAHDAAHSRLFTNKFVNDAVGSFCGAVVGISMRTYRITHRLHHNHLYKEQDPDVPIHGGYPRGRDYLIRKLLTDLTGQTAVKTYQYFFGMANSKRPLEDTSDRLRSEASTDSKVVAVTQVGMATAALVSGYGAEYAGLWLLPLVTILQQFLRLRSICEHGAVQNIDSPLTAARTNLGPAPLLWFFMPHNVNYHIEHHMHPSIPHTNLPEAHAEMKRRGLLEHAEVADVRDTLVKVFGERKTAKPSAE